MHTSANTQTYIYVHIYTYNIYGHGQVQMSCTEDRERQPPRAPTIKDEVGDGMIQMGPVHI